MNNRNMKKKQISAKKGGSNKKRFSMDKDPFFKEKGSKRRRRGEDQEDIESEEEDDFGFEAFRLDDENDKEKEDEEEEVEETAAQKRMKFAMTFLQTKKEQARRKEEEEDGDDEDRVEKEGPRDSVVAEILQRAQLEESGRARRRIASRIQKPESTDGFRELVKHRQTVTAVALFEDDSQGVSASKDGSIMQWDIESGKIAKYSWPNFEVLKSHGVKDPQGRVKKHSQSVVALAVSSDGRYLASGGLDRHVHLWDIRTHQHVQAFPGHKGPISCLAFRQGTSELFSGSFDRSIKIWNVEDRTYMSTLFGHQSEVLTIDCLRKERVLTVGRDRTMHLFKVPEETQLIFRAPASSLECCCFISNQEFLSGSDDGRIEHWNILRKKPVHIVKNAHASMSTQNLEQAHGGLSNGDIENASQGLEDLFPSAVSWVSSVAVCRNSDLAASGAGNGLVRLWAVEPEMKGLSPLFELPVVGFVNSLAFAKSGKFLVAGIGQEPRLGRWGRIREAGNGVFVHSLNHTS